MCGRSDCVCGGGLVWTVNWYEVTVYVCVCVCVCVVTAHYATLNKM